MDRHPQELITVHVRCTNPQCGLEYDQTMTRAKALDLIRGNDTLCCGACGHPEHLPVLVYTSRPGGAV